jgi:pyruvate/2-oxoglutarate dehydrogenase complex dihydrolipoamide acyltransferase (E2) component
MKNDIIGAFQELTVSAARTAVWDTVRLGKARHHVPVMFEADVTAARAAMSKLKQEAEHVSFSGWALKCVAQAANEHGRVHALRHGRRKIVVFKDVDVSLALYRRLNGGNDERLPMPYVLRKANEKSVEQISGEIHHAQTVRLAPGEQWLDPSGNVPPPWLLRLAFTLPHQLRRAVYWDRLLADPWRVKRTMGTVMVTSVPVTSKSSHGGWAIPIGIHPLVVAIGSVSRKPWVVQDRVEARDVLSLTVLFDHDVVDGVPVALFLRRLTELLEGAFGLTTA